MFGREVRYIQGFQTRVTGTREGVRRWDCGGLTLEDNLKKGVINVLLVEVIDSSIILLHGHDLTHNIHIYTYMHILSYYTGFKCVWGFSMQGKIK